MGPVGSQGFQGPYGATGAMSGTLIHTGSVSINVCTTPVSNILTVTGYVTQAATAFWITGTTWDNSSVNFRVIDTYVTGPSPIWMLTADLYSTSSYTSGANNYTFYYAYI
jgi:hypothetical protein